MSGGTVVIVIGSGGHRAAGKTDPGAVKVIIEGLPPDASNADILETLKRAEMEIECRCA